MFSNMLVIYIFLTNVVVVKFVLIYVLLFERKDAQIKIFLFVKEINRKLDGFSTFEFLSAVLLVKTV